MEALILRFNLNTGAWTEVYFGNTAGEYLIALVAFVVFLIVLKIVQVLIVARLHKLAQKTETDIDDMLVAMVHTIRPPLYSFIAFYGALRFLTVHSVLQQAVSIVLVVVLVYQAILMAQVLTDHVLTRSVKGVERENKNTVKFLGNFVKGALWILGALLILQNLGVNVTSLIAGLGIAGLAIGLAAQNILEDLFSSFAIVFDKPFVVGDFITVEKRSGIVEKIGVKTTRVRASQGEEIVISNKELTSAQVQNFKRLKERRGVLILGVLYETPNEKLEKIPRIVEAVVGSVEGARFDRTHLIAFSDSSLDFETIYYVESDVYRDFLDVQHKVNLQLKAVFEKEGIGISYPTRTLYLNK